MHVVEKSRPYAEALPISYTVLDSGSEQTAQGPFSSTNLRFENPGQAVDVLRNANALNVTFPFESEGAYVQFIEAGDYIGAKVSVAADDPVFADGDGVEQIALAALEELGLQR